LLFRYQKKIEGILGRRTGLKAKLIVYLCTVRSTEKEKLIV